MQEGCRKDTGKMQEGCRKDAGRMLENAGRRKVMATIGLDDYSCSEGQIGAMLILNYNELV